MSLILVAGAGGLHCRTSGERLREEGCDSIRAVDQKPVPEWYQRFDDVENYTLDRATSGLRNG